MTLSKVVKMKVLITGAAGMLGSYLIQTLKESGHTGIPTDKDEYYCMDITNADQTDNVISDWHPDFVIHCAAMTDVDGCELNPEKAFAINTIGTLNVAKACVKAKATLIYISTDYVFDGSSSLYFTNSATNPLNVYGHSKLAGEKLIQTYCENYYIVRTSWLYAVNGKNFANTILDKAERGEELRVVDDQFGSPTYVPDLAKYLVWLVETPLSSGIRHYTNIGECSWYDFASCLLDMSNLKDAIIRPIKSDQLTNNAVRPKRSVLCKQSEPETLMLRFWDHVVSEYVAERVVYRNLLKEK